MLWLLHGTYGDDTDSVRKSNIELYACERDLVVVMPSALNSNYSNWDPVSDKREDDFIAGLLMGGGGTLKLAVNLQRSLPQPPYFHLHRRI